MSPGSSIFSQAQNAPAAVREGGTFVGHLVAPNGELSFCANSTIRGVLIGRTVVIGPQSNVTVEGELPSSPDAGVRPACTPASAHPAA